MIVSKIKVNEGYAFIDIIFKKKQKRADVLFFAQKEDIQVFSSDFWESLDGEYIKDLYYENGTDRALLCKWCTTKLMTNNFGTNSKVISLKDLKIIRTEIANTVYWLKGLGYSVSFSPVDESRAKATVWLLQKSGIKFIMNLTENEVLIQICND